MKHIKTPMKVFEFNPIGAFADVQDADGETYIEDIYTEQAAELVTAINALDPLVEALRRTANNYDIWKAGETELCWCRGWDFEVWHGCKGEPPCVAAREALALLVEEGV